MTVVTRPATTPWRMPLRAWRSIAVSTWNEAMEDNIGLAAAGVAFYVFLAIVPLLTAIVRTYGIFAGPETVLRHMRALTGLMPAAAARSVGEQLMTVVQGSDKRKGIGLVLAIAIALFGARNGAGALVSALNIAYDEKETRSFLRINLIALAITVAGAAGAILAALSVAGMTAIGQLFPSDSRVLVILGTIISYALLTLVGAGVSGALYRCAPCRPHARWVWISPGSILAGLLWLALTLGFGTYVSRIAHYDASYGSLGAAIGLLSWVYLSAYVLLFGAELNSELDQRVRPPAGENRPMRAGRQPAIRSAPRLADASMFATKPIPSGEPASSGARIRRW